MTSTIAIGGGAAATGTAAGRGVCEGGVYAGFADCTGRGVCGGGVYAAGFEGWAGRPEGAGCETFFSCVVGAASASGFFKPSLLSILLNRLIADPFYDMRLIYLTPLSDYIIIA
jgi:hypothetical protein